MFRGANISKQRNRDDGLTLHLGYTTSTGDPPRILQRRDTGLPIDTFTQDHCTKGENSGCRRYGGNPVSWRLGTDLRVRPTSLYTRSKAMGKNNEPGIQSSSWDSDDCKDTPMSSTMKTETSRSDLRPSATSRTDSKTYNPDNSQMTEASLQTSSGHPPSGRLLPTQ